MTRAPVNGDAVAAIPTSCPTLRPRSTPAGLGSLPGLSVVTEGSSPARIHGRCTASPDIPNNRRIPRQCGSHTSAFGQFHGPWPTHSELWESSRCVGHAADPRRSMTTGDNPADDTPARYTQLRASNHPPHGSWQNFPDLSESSNGIGHAAHQRTSMTTWDSPTDDTPAHHTQVRASN